jgi:hypothetical protein
MFDPTGTIGSMPCELSLNKILADKNDPRITKKIMKLLYVTKFRLKQLQNISDPATYTHFKIMLKHECENSVMKITGNPTRGQGKLDPLTSHTMCCLHAYFNIKQKDE